MMGFETTPLNSINILYHRRDILPLAITHKNTINSYTGQQSQHNSCVSGRTKEAKRKHAEAPEGKAKVAKVEKNKQNDGGTPWKMQPSVSSDTNAINPKRSWPVG